MRRRTSVVLALAVVGLVAACSDVPSAPAEQGLTEFRGNTGALEAGTCTTLGALNGLARQVFRTASPNVNSVLGKLKNLDQQVKKGRLEKAVAGAHDIVDFTLKHYRAGRLPGTEAELTAFVNAVYCFAGIDLDINQPGNSHLILPSDQEQVVYSIDSKAAIKFGANPVSEPTLIEFEQLPDTFTVPGAGPLDTKLDQYPGFLMITKSSETDAALLRPAVVGVCAGGVIPQAVRDRLRLGHGKSTGFEVAPPADAGFLDCENLTAEVVDAGVLGKLARLLLPKELHAGSARYFAGGGIGGTVTEFSPFAPVDPELRSGGGIGGTVTEFTRAPSAGALLFSNSLLPVEVVCTTITAIEQMQVAANCRPFLRVTTRLGTVLSEVPVSWAATTGGGLVAPQSDSECGGFAAVIVHPTDLLGRSGICWKLGAPGLNQVTATPGVGGDAPAGVTFVPATVTFDAQATLANLGLPTRIILLEGSGQNAPAGHHTFVAPKVKVTDDYGNPVAGARVSWLVIDGTGSVSPAQVITDADGLASATWTVSAGYNRLKAYIDQVVFASVYFEANGFTTP